MSIFLIHRIASYLKRPAVFILIGLCAAATLLSFYRLGYHSLWCDEAVSHFIASHSVSSIFHYTLRYERPVIDVNPPLYFLILHYILHLGRSEWWLRLPSVIFGISLLPVLYLFWRKLFSIEVALLAVALITFSPAYVSFCQNARLYTMMLLLFYLAFYFLLKALEDGNLWHWRIYCLLILISLYTTYLTAFLIVTNISIVALWSLYNFKKQPKNVRRSWIRFAISLAIAGGLALPAAPGYYFARSLSRYADAPFTQEFFRSFRDEYFWLSDWRFFLIVGLMLAGLVYALLQRTYSALMLALLIFVPVIFAGISRPMRFVPRHVLLTLPALLLLLAFGVKLLAHLVSALPSLRPYKQRVLTYVFVAFSVLYITTYSQSLGWHYSVPLQNWRDAVAFVRANALPGDRIVTGLFYVEHCFFYYDPLSWQRYDFRNRILDYEKFRNALLAPKRVWYITSFQNLIPQEFMAVLTENFECLKVVPGRHGAPDIYIYFRDGR